MGVVTGIPLEFRFGANWRNSRRLPAMLLPKRWLWKGGFAFVLESAFVGLLLFGERRFGQRVHWLAAFMVFPGTWTSRFSIIVTNAWMQNPVGYTPRPDGGSTSPIKSALLQCASV
jgi:cytochrome d ubiquinol oxidase subunit I